VDRVLVRSSEALVVVQQVDRLDDQIRGLH
jgi:hypothetical protein